MYVSVVKALALTTLSYIVDETQLDLLRLDSEMLQFFLSKVQGSLAEGTAVNAQCVASEVIRGLSNLAKNDFNKRLMVSQGKYRTSVIIKVHQITSYTACNRLSFRTANSFSQFCVSIILTDQFTRT